MLIPLSVICYLVIKIVYYLCYLQSLPGVPLHCLIHTGRCSHLTKMTIMVNISIITTLTSAATFATASPDLGSKPVCSIAS